jgi:hypothetical protein
MTTVQNENREVVATVIAVIPEFNQAEIGTQDGYRYALTEHTPGIRLCDVRAGQRYRCTVTTRWARVLQAELLED